MDFKGKNPYMLVIIDKFSRFPFAFQCRNISTKTVMYYLDKLFCVFGFPSYIHSDRGSSFMSHEQKLYLRARGIASSRSTPYHPCSNGQCERCVQTVWRTIKLKLHKRSLSEERWEIYFLNRSTLYDLLCVWHLTKLRMIVCLSLIADL